MTRWKHRAGLLYTLCFFPLALPLIGFLGVMKLWGEWKEEWK